ncbi:LOW QUALITY PROTEIN: axial regulator YABBY 4-like [Asparagus officinalis]|uniref:LOW QUALITY PROTEIN: axial regulator YABBY 4-like n=1 Tax=Asparagus officinalis TaxID=4686 RepID=UPI00098E5A85|nr:LOW QUALITY PROTEIN: axial regulator YABBY 4-like [Asparagus officinalis]
MTSSCNPFMELPDQLGYVQCSFCATNLLVSVPCSSLLKMVTVKCGHCTCLLSVSLARASLLPLHLLASLGDDEEINQLTGDVLPKTCNDGEDGTVRDEEERERELPLTHLLNKPPEKRQRAPSAYNRFIKEEIQRIKAREPSITHKEAFSTAAKNWAHFPRLQHKHGKGESSSCGEEKKARDGGTNEEDN